MSAWKKKGSAISNFRSMLVAWILLTQDTFKGAVWISPSQIMPDVQRPKLSQQMFFKKFFSLLLFSLVYFCTVKSRRRTSAIYVALYYYLLNEVEISLWYYIRYCGTERVAVESFHKMKSPFLDKCRDFTKKYRLCASMD